MPSVALGPRKREFLVYLAGALFAAGWWTFIDATLLSRYAINPLDPKSPHDGIPVHVAFPDWIPGILSTLGMIIINLIDKEQLKGDDEGGDWQGASWGGSVAWRARLFLFVGFALLAGGLAGSITVLVIKYIVPAYPESFGVNWGIANVAQSIAIMLSAIVLWTAQNAESEYEYSLTL